MRDLGDQKNKVNTIQYREIFYNVILYQWLNLLQKKVFNNLLL